MPSPTRETVRRNFSITREASEAIDDFAAEHDTTMSKVVENAVLQYTDNDTTARIESKVDEILATLEEGHASPAQTSRKEKNSQSDTHTEPVDYNPDENRENPLTKDEIRDVIAEDEPVINPDHVDNSDFPGSVKEKSDMIAAIVRYNTRSFDRGYFSWGHIKAAIKTHLGESDHMIDQYVDPVKDRFPRRHTLDFDKDEGYNGKPSGLFPTEDAQREYYQDRFETVQNVVDTPIHELPELPEVDDYGPTKPYEFHRQWITDYQIKNALQELDIATEDELAELEEELLTCRDELDKCLSVIEKDASDSTSMDTDFTHEEAVEAAPYDEEQSEAIVDLLIDVGYLGEYESSLRDMGVNEKLIWRD